tara:strand:- start:1243 stop:1470 length:228 start_codon:yes stop_codon:yes gene_type:complete
MDSYEKILYLNLLEKIKGGDISQLSGDELDWLKSRPDIMHTVAEAGSYNKIRDDQHFKDVVSGTIEEILIDLKLQ